jgi:hypothetical protein
MTPFVELEIGLQKIDDAVHVTLRFDRSDSEADVSPILGLAAFDADVSCERRPQAVWSATGATAFRGCKDPDRLWESQRHGRVARDAIACAHFH